MVGASAGLAKRDWVLDQIDDLRTAVTIERSVKADNATGDGATDDTAAFHAARDSGAKVIHVPAGVYITTGISLSVSDQTWVFAPGAFLKLGNAFGGSAITVLATRVTIVDPGVDGNKANQTAGGGGIWVQVADCTIVRPKIKNTRGAGIVGSNTCHNLDIDHGSITEFGSANGGGISVVAGFGSQLIGVAVIGTRLSTSDISADADGIGFSGNLDGSGNVVGSIVGARIIGVHVTLPANSAAICIEVWGGCPRTVIDGPVTVGGTMGVSMDRSEGSVCTGYSVYGPSFCGVEVAVYGHVSIGPGTVDGNGVTENCVSISSPVTDKPSHVSITGLVARNWKPTGFAVHALQTDHLSITGGSVDGTNQPFNLQACTEVSVIGVHFDGKGAAQDAINFDNCNGGLVDDCTFDNFTRSGVFIWAGSQNIVVGDANRKIGSFDLVGFYAAGANNVIPGTRKSSTQTGAAYTFTVADAGRPLYGNRATAQTFTIPLDTYPIDQELEVIQLGAGQITLAIASGGTLNARGGALKIAGQFGGAVVKQTAANVWVAVGDLTT